MTDQAKTQIEEIAEKMSSFNPDDATQEEINAVSTPDFELFYQFGVKLS